MSIFFNPSEDYPIGSIMKLDRNQFMKPSLEIRSLFVDEIASPDHQPPRLRDIKFWKPIEPVSIQEAVQVEWRQKFNNFGQYFISIPWAAAFSDVSEDEISDERRLHLVVTAHVPPARQEIGDKHEETRDSVGDLPQQQLFKATLMDKGPSPSKGSTSEGYASIQSKLTQKIFDGRYTEYHSHTIAPPVEIFHPEFDIFRRRLHIATPSRDDLIKVLQFMKIASQIHPGEARYAAKLRSALSDILSVALTSESDTDTTISDSVYSFDLGSFRLAILFMEIKREWGEGGFDSSTQDGLSMKRAWSDNDKPGTVEIRSKCCCPTFILAGGGPWLGVLGGVFTDRVIVQRLTDMMWIGQSSTHEDSRVYRFAQMLVALRESLLALKQYYTDLLADDSPGFRPNVPHPRFFPYPTSCQADDRVICWSYVKSLQLESTCVTYLVKEENSSQLLVVKFVDRYGQEAHRLLAAEGLAPTLHYCSSVISSPVPSLVPARPPLPGITSGPVQMVVMDYIEAGSATVVDPLTPMRAQIKTIVTKLHKAGYIFGDLRVPNIILDKSGHVQLINFDWAGRYDMTIEEKLLNTDARDLIPDEVREAMKSGQNAVDNAGFAVYPLDLSRSAFENTGAEDLISIRPAHDWRILGMLRLPDGS